MCFGFYVLVSMFLCFMYVSCWSVRLICRDCRPSEHILIRRSGTAMLLYSPIRGTPHCYVGASSPPFCEMTTDFHLVKKSVCIESHFSYESLNREILVKKIKVKTLFFQYFLLLTFYGHNVIHITRKRKLFPFI